MILTKSRQNHGFYESDCDAPLSIQVLFSIAVGVILGSIWDGFLIFFFHDFGIKKGVQSDVKVSIDLGSDFEAFGAPFSFLLDLFWLPLGANWGSWGREGEAREGSRSVRNGVLAPGSLQEALGTSF